MHRRRLVIGFACLSLLIPSCGSASDAANAHTAAMSHVPRPAAPADAEGLGVTLVDVSDADEVATWTTVNDPVMGGLSTSRVTFANGGLMFSGTISLENNGGFASARSPRDPGIGQRAAGATSLRMRAEGDGKTYLMKVGVAGQPWSYVQRFATEAAAWRIYELPVADFQAVGMRLEPEPDAPQTLDPSSINQIAFYILDKQQGPFELSISAVGAAA